MKQDNSPMEDTEDDVSLSPTAKVPESYQEEAQELIDGLKTEAELDFVSSLIDTQRKAIASSQKKSGLATDKFSTEDMPKD